MITETETAFLAVVRAFLTEEKAALEELAALTEKQWNHLFVLAAQHSLLSAVYDVVGKTPEFAELPDELRRQVKTQAMQSVLQQVSRTALFLSDEKELAEHNMLVDLGRNDLGRFCRFGTVEVEKYLSVEKFSHVMHLGSTVRGELRSDKTALDALQSVLPAGTLSGAPKLRACQIINDLENNKRGIYGGAIGYLDFAGNMDMCIAIRLAFCKNGKVFVRSGAGIVADSVAPKEYQECINKAKAVVLTLQEAQKLGKKGERA